MRFHAKENNHVKRYGFVQIDVNTTYGTIVTADITTFEYIPSCKYLCWIGNAALRKNYVLKPNVLK